MEPRVLELDERTRVVYSGNGDDRLGKGATAFVWPCTLTITSGESTESHDVAVKHAKGQTNKCQGLEQELEIWQQVPAHEHVVKLWGTKVIKDPESGTLDVFTVMDRFPNDLKGTIFSDGRFAETCTYKDVLEILTGVCKGLKYLHDLGVIHHDLKPENILMGEGNRPNVGDFGLSKMITDGHASVTASTRGTRQYMAPEVLASPLFRDPNIRVNRAVDVYSLGGVMWVLLNRTRIGGSVSIDGPGKYINWGAVGGDQIMWCGGPEELCNLVERCWQFTDVTDKACDHGRPQVGEVLKALKDMENRPWTGDRVPAYYRV